MPFKRIDIGEDFDRLENVQESSMASDRNRSRARKTLVNQQVMTTDEKVKLRTDIRARFGQPPYSGALMFQEFAISNGTYAEVLEADTPQESY